MAFAEAKALGKALCVLDKGFVHSVQAKQRSVYTICLLILLLYIITSLLLGIGMIKQMTCTTGENEAGLQLLGFPCRIVAYSRSLSREKFYSADDESAFVVRDSAISPSITIRSSYLQIL